MNKLKLEEEIKDSIYLNGTKDDGKYSLNLEQLEQVGKESVQTMQDVAIKFLTFVESNYYYNSGCWLDCDTDKTISRQDLFNKFINE